MPRNKSLDSCQKPSRKAEYLVKFTFSDNQLCTQRLLLLQQIIIADSKAWLSVTYPGGTRGWHLASLCQLKEVPYLHYVRMELAI